MAFIDGNLDIYLGGCAKAGMAASLFSYNNWMWDNLLLIGNSVSHQSESIIGLRVLFHIKFTNI